MSDEDRDVDIESDEEDDDQDDGDGSSQAPVDKRAHHNALERKRRDHIKDSFHNLRDSVPTVHGEKVSRAQILKKAADYIVQLREKNAGHTKDIENMKKTNQVIQNQISAGTQGHKDRLTDWAERDRIRLLEKFTETAKYTEATRTRQQAKLQGAGPVSESSEEDDSTGQPSRKKLKQSVDS